MSHDNEDTDRDTRTERLNSIPSQPALRNMTVDATTSDSARTADESTLAARAAETARETIYRADELVFANRWVRGAGVLAFASFVVSAMLTSQQFAYGVLAGAIMMVFVFMLAEGVITNPTTLRETATRNGGDDE